MIEIFDVSLMNERNEEILREARANRIGKRLRKDGVHRASLLAALLESVGRGAGSRSERRPHRHRTSDYLEITTNTRG